VHSGKDGRLLWQVKKSCCIGFGTALLGDLDLDGDRRPDLVVTATQWPPGGHSVGAVYAYSNKGKLLYRVDGKPSLQLGIFQGPYTLGRVGDLDRDGADDFVVGGIGPGWGAGVVLSGRTGKVLVIGRETTTREAIGRAADGLGDIDGDGVPDFAASSSGGPGKLGTVEAFSGRTGKRLFLLQGSTYGSSFGWAFRGGGHDYDRDGVPDLVVGGPVEKPKNLFTTGMVSVFSGRDHTAIHAVWGCVPRGRPCWAALLGEDLAVSGPQPGSPFPVFLASEPRYDYYWSKWGASARGRLRLFRGTPAGARTFGSACAGKLGASPRIGIRALGKRGVRIHLSGAPPSARAWLMLGLSRRTWGPAKLPLDLALVGLPGCKLYTSIELLAPATTGSQGIAKGYAFVDLGLPLAAPGKEWFTLYGQWLVAGNGTRTGLSEAMQWKH